MQSDQFTAKLLRTSLEGYAGLATGRLCESVEGGAEAIGGFEGWKANLRDVLGHLAAAVEDGSPQEFASHMRWARESWVARSGSEDHIEAMTPILLGLSCLRQVLQDSLPDQAWSVVETCLAEGESALRCADSAPAATTGSSNALADSYQQALRAGTLQEAEELLQRALDEGRVGLQDVLDNIIPPALCEVGLLWQRGEIDVAEEHMISAAARSTLANLSRRGEARPQRARTIVIAAVAGNAHELGAHAISILFEVAGWRVFCTGADTPAEDIALLCERSDADLLALSATIATQRESAAATIARVRASRPEQRVLVGGNAFGENEQLWRRIGADAYARNGGDAVSLSAELCGFDD